MRRSRLAIPLITMQLAGCGGGSPNASAGAAAGVAAARDAVTHRMDNYLTQAQAQDTTSLFDYWAPGAIIVEPEAMMTDAEIRGMLGGFLEANRFTEFKITSSEVAAHDGGAVVYQFGTYTESVMPKKGGAATHFNNNFGARWIKLPDGVYRMDRFIAVPRPKENAAPLPVVTNGTPIVVAGGDPALAGAEVAQRMQAHIAALRSNDVPAIMAFWADDAQMFDAEVQILNKAELTTFVNGFLGDHRITDVQLTSGEITVHDGGQVAYQFGNYAETFEPKAGGPPSTSRRNFLARWEKKDGTWVMDRLIATPAPRDTAATK